MTDSSTNMPETMDAEFNDQASILSNDPMENPHFYNWNRVYVLYCDGFSFSGNRFACLQLCLHLVLLSFFQDRPIHSDNRFI